MNIFVKRVFVILPALFLFFNFIGIVNAAGPDVWDTKLSNGYLNMQSYDAYLGDAYLDKSGGTLNNVFNGTSAALANLAATKTVWTQFTHRYNGDNYFANLIKLKFEVMPYSHVPVDFDVTFYDINGNVLRTISNPTVNQDILINLNQVFGFSLKNNHTITDVNHRILINEIWVDGVLYNYRSLNIDPIVFKLENLNYIFESPQRVRVSWDELTTNFLKNFDVYIDGVKNSTITLNHFYLNNPIVGQTYVIEVVPRDMFEREYRQNNIVTFTIPQPDTTPPTDPLGLTVNPDRYDAVARWQPNTEADLLGYILYLDGNRITNNPSRATTFTISNLSPDTEYLLELSAVDTSNNESGKISVRFKTMSLISPPDAPLNLTGNAFNGGAQLNWLPSRYAEEYYIYQNGVKIGDTKGTSFKLTGLTNGTSYDYQVTAVNSVGESQKSNLITLIPDPNKAPPITLGYGLSDLAKGVSDWFTSFWGILAFCIAIPLAFYIGNRVKGLMTT